MIKESGHLLDNPSDTLFSHSHVHPIAEIGKSGCPDKIIVVLAGNLTKTGEMTKRTEIVTTAAITYANKLKMATDQSAAFIFCGGVTRGDHTEAEVMSAQFQKSIRPIKTQPINIYSDSHCFNTAESIQNVFDLMEEVFKNNHRLPGQIVVLAEKDHAKRVVIEVDKRNPRSVPTIVVPADSFIRMLQGKRTGDPESQAYFLELISAYEHSPEKKIRTVLEIAHQILQPLGMEPLMEASMAFARKKLHISGT